MSRLVVKESCEFKTCSDITELVIESGIEVTCLYGFGDSPSDMKVEVNSGSRLLFKAIEAGSGDFKFDLVGDDACVKFVSLHVKGGDSKTKFRVSGDCKANNCSFSANLYCALSDRAFADIAGEGVVSLGASGCDVSVVQKNLLLNRGVSIINTPPLLITGDDVSAEHKSSMMRLNEDDEFFLRSRGVEDPNALLLSGFYEEIKNTR
jgi:Fe-S cluster assembly scaffold protein SufB